MATKRRLNVALSSVLTLLAVPAATTSTVDPCLWSKSASVDVSSMTKVISASSKIRCGATCLKRWDCSNFCYDDVSRFCYIQDPQSSQPLPQGISKCFKHKYKGCPAGCPKTLGYSLTEGMCLKLMDFSMTYSEATTSCKGIFGHVVAMKTAEERDTIKRFSENEGYETLSFLGLHNYTSTRDIVWPDGSVLFSTSSLWATGEPSGDGTRQCACVADSGADLQVCTCSYRRRFICQVDV